LEGHPDGSLYPLTTVVLAWLLLRERASLPQGVGVAGALAGVALVLLGA
jgi:drug/metabolite transporter (DMT)-like permease